MKKVLLSAAVIFGAYFATAQTCTVGLTETAVYDDFSSIDNPSNEDGTAGLYMWENIALGEDEENPEFAFTATRTGSELDVVLTQAYGKYAPFGVSFGDETTLDLSGDATFEVKATNNGDSTIKFRMAIQDVTKKNIDTYAAGLDDTWGNAYKHTIEISLEPGESKMLSGTYAGGAYADYEIAKGYVTGFDFTKVSAVLFTVANANQNADDDYKNYAIEDYPVSIEFYRIGNCDGQVGTKAAVKLETAVYPNPATSVVNFGQTLTNVAVYNSNGILVETLNSASSINVESFKAGVYLINSTEGATRFVVK